MTQTLQAPAIRGKTIRLTWTEGPTKGGTYEHVFHEDGTVEWRRTDQPAEKPAAGQSKKPAPAAERPNYGAVRVTDEVYIVSYLASSGYTLTVALNFRDHTMVGFASGAKEWYPVGGTFEVAQGR